MNEESEFWVRYVRGVAVLSLAERDGSRLLAGDGLSQVIALERGRVVVELDPERHVPSAVLGKLILIHRRAQAVGGPRVRLCCAAGPAREELRVTKLDRVLPTFETIDDAVRDC